MHIQKMEKEKNYIIKPFVKWAGGKTQLLDKLLTKIPKNYKNYFEPFLGGGALFLKLQPEFAYINDINKELINTYLQIKNNPDKLIKIVQKLDLEIRNKEFYYQQRDKYNKKIIDQEYDIEMAALFIFLNKHCFNGLYRVNKNGLFNVPWNNKTNIKSISVNNIKQLSLILNKNVEISCGDFEKILNKAKEQDLIFFDSPYAPINPTSFESYTKTGFTKDDHIRLSNVYKQLDKKGCYCILTNHNTPLIKDLYNCFNIEKVNVKRMINSDAKNRTGNEIIITNY